MGGCDRVIVTRSHTQVRLKSARCRKNRLPLPGGGQPSDQTRRSWFIHHIVNSFQCQQLVFEVIILTLRVSLDFFYLLRRLMRDDFCNSDRRSSLSDLLVTLNASNKSFGRRQQSSSEGIFCSSVLPEKKGESFLKCRV